MRELVIHGIVEVMNERQMEARTKSLHGAIERMSVARQARGGEIADIEFGFESVLDEHSRKNRRRIFRFGDRARRAVGDGDIDG